MSVLLSHAPRPLIDCDIEDDNDDFDDGGGLVSTEIFEEDMRKFRRVLLELSDILEYNAPLTDLRTFPILRRRFAAISELHTSLIEKEKVTNSVTGLAPKT